MTSVRPVRKDAFLKALLAADRSPEVIRATGVAVALALTARSDGTRACLSGQQLAVLFAGGGADTTARRHLKVLRDAGWIVQTLQGGRRGNKVYASLYDLSQPSTQMDGWDTVPNRPRLTLQPSTQVDAPSPKRGPRPHLGVGSPEVAPHPARPDDAFLATEVHRLKTGECGPITDSLLERWRKWATDLGVEPDHVEELLADVVVPARLTPPQGLFPDPPQRVDVA